jgi:hypothetical protein
MIFDYLDIPETTSLPPWGFIDVTATPLWEARILHNIWDSEMSGPFFYSQSIRFTINGGKKLFGVIISYPYNEDPAKPLAQLLMLLEKDKKINSNFGYNKAVHVTGQADIYLLNYSWPDEQHQDLSAVWLYKGGDHPRRCIPATVLDEESGRVIAKARNDLPSGDGKTHVIWDFALLYK